MLNTKLLDSAIKIFKGTSLLSIDQLTRAKLDVLYALTDDIVANPTDFLHVADGKIMSAIFYEPSTRTSSSFLSAMQRLGGGTIPITGVEFSSVSKGETLEDTITTLSCYSDIVVLRHPEPGTAQRATKASQVPLINAGDGVGEHPTQALLDGYTIQKNLGKLDAITVTMVGDLKHGRTVHSLSRLLSNYKDVKVNYVSPQSLRMPKQLMSQLSSSGLSQTEHTDLGSVIAETDALYVTRVQQERFKDDKDYQAVKGIYTITPKLLKKAREKMIVMHPLPRVDEISTDVDSDPRAVYFDQVKNGMYVRMALLSAVVG